MASVRVRITLVAIAVVAVALLAGSAVLVLTLRSNLIDEALTTAELRAATLAASLEDGDGDVRLVVPGDDEFAQIQDSSGTVVWASDEALNGALDPPAPGRSTVIIVPIEDGRFAVAAASAGDLTVIAGRNLEHVDESTSTLIGLLAIGLPVLTLLLGFVTWAVVGRALKPVERIRAEVETITAADLDQRVPVPATKDEIGRLAETMNTMLERLEASQARQRRFVSDASHELRSPLASIRQHSEVALAHPGSIGDEELAASVLADALRMQGLVEDLLLLARADEQSLGTRTTDVDLDDLALEEARRLREATELDVDTSGVTATRIEGDPAALRRLIRNLGENAARYATSRIAISTGGNGSMIELVVEDDGPGIQESDRTEVFERFVRLDEARARDDGGYGLGLAIVSEVAASHHGSARITDGRLGGARVEVRLPLLF